MHIHMINTAIRFVSAHHNWKCQSILQDNRIIG